ncbi:DNA fragmentation factor subunit beta [Chionoecetes opilio]|uniref:DNAation factor subunit beta n=1 Tax=Chionoecetes opilio TaxID=41210 RepID=A0A8J5CMM9_CHIOP|nr:DNA fragmentation factor subunit beta [Chionoecetes opilio]
MLRHFVVCGPAQRKCGIVASNYEEFLKKCRKKFELKKHNKILITLDDETEVDEEYFEYLVDDTKLLISRSKTIETTDYIHQLASFLHACLDRQPQLHSKVMGCLQEPVTSRQAVTLLELIAKATQASTPLMSREEDVEWFKGLDTKFKTKEAVMRNSAFTRMYSYLDHAKRELLPDKMLGDSPQSKAILFFKEKLVKSKYNASYFDRSALSDEERLCGPEGLFGCEGPFDQHKCSGIHFINPYASREARIVFSTWNFDHVIEKSRTIIPELKAALSGPRPSSVNLHYFYDLLFLHKNSLTAAKNTNGNLKLVHIACHVKKQHQCECEPEKIFLDRHDDVDGLCAQYDPGPRGRGLKRPQPLPDASYYTRSKRMQGSTDCCVGNGSNV